MSATLASKTTIGQAGSTGGLAAILCFGVAVWNTYNPDNQLSTEAAVGTIALLLTVLSPVVSRFVATVRKPEILLPDPSAMALQVRLEADKPWIKLKDKTVVEAQYDGWDYAVVVRPDGDGDVLDLRTGKVKEIIRLPHPNG